MLKLSTKIPWPVTWIIRIACWWFVLFIIGGMLFGYGRFRLAGHIEECLSEPLPKGLKETTLVSRQRLVSCVDTKTGFPENILFYTTKKMIGSLPSAPCRYAGIWEAKRPQSIYLITLQEDGRFFADPVKTNEPGAGAIIGVWGVVGNKMVWLYDEGVIFPIDANPIKEIDTNHFILSEHNGTKTSYTLVDRINSKKCPFEQ